MKSASRFLRRALSAVVLILAFNPGVYAESYLPYTVHDVDLLDNGHLLVTDGGALGAFGGIFEIDRTGIVHWSYAAGLNFAHNADKQSDGRVIISDTGNDRVIIVDATGNVVWNSSAVTLSDGTALDYPNDANLLPSGNLLITDRNNHRVIEITLAGQIVWRFGQTGSPGGGPNHLNGPHNADRLAGGNTIIVDSNNNRVLEVTPAGAVVWIYAAGLNWPRDADRLENGNTLINDSNNRRIIEISPTGALVWQYTVSDISYDSDRLAGGNTLISSGGRILEVDSAGAVVGSYPVLYQTEVLQGYLVTAPNGSNLWVKIIQPRATLYPGQVFPAVVSVPGGLGAGENGNLNVAVYGFAEFHFNAEGRGIAHPSDGSENHNGCLHQDNLKAVIEYAQTHPNVAANNIGVITGSYGITMGAGCLGRYPELPVKYLIDQEGPSESFVHGFEPWSLDANPSNDRLNQGYSMFGHWSIYRDSAAANIAWWSEREPTRFIGAIRCRYLRMQAQWDHAQPPNTQWPGFDYPPLWFPCKHALDLVNSAVRGASPWVRVNGRGVGNAVNALYSRENPPRYYPGRMQDYPRELAQLIWEMAAMPPPLDPVSDLTIAASETTVLLRWSAVAGATAYDIYRLSAAEQPPADGEILTRTTQNTFSLPGEITTRERAFFVVIAVQE